MSTDPTQIANVGMQQLWPRAPGGAGVDRSVEIKDLAVALAKAQAQIKPAAKDSSNPYFKSKYADLASVMNACREALTANDLAIVQRAIGQGDIVGVTTTLMHGSGQWIEGTITVRLEDATPQAVGSALTYLRRYSLASMVGVAPDDDDGEAAQPRRQRHADPHAANDNGSARLAGTPPAPDGKAQAASSGRSTPRQWGEYDALRQSMHVTEDAGLARVSAITGRALVNIGDLSAKEMDEVLGLMREAAGKGA